MFKKMVMLLSVLIGIILFGTPVLAGEYNYSYLKTVELTIGQKTATVNGAAYTMDQAAFVRNGRTLVPLRFLGEAMGARVNWDSKAATAVLQLKSSEVKVALGSKKAYINTRQADLDVPAEARGGRIFVPLRFVSEALGAKVDFENETKKIRISLIDTAQWKKFTSQVIGGTILYPPDWAVQEAVYLKITSPLGSQMLFKIVPDDPAEVLAQRSSFYTKAGFKKESEFPVDPKDPGKGKNINFVLEDKNNPDNSDLAGLYVSTTGKGTLVIELSGKYGVKAKDIPVLYQIIAGIQQ